jgi:hypothetical protein
MLVFLYQFTSCNHAFHYIILLQSVFRILVLTRKFGNLSATLWLPELLSKYVKSRGSDVRSWVPLGEQELSTLPQHPGSSPIFEVVVLVYFLFSLLCFVNHCLYFFHFSIGHCIVCPLICSFWLLLIQTCHVYVHWHSITWCRHHVCGVRPVLKYQHL